MNIINKAYKSFRNNLFIIAVIALLAMLLILIYSTFYGIGVSRSNNARIAQEVVQTK